MAHEPRIQARLRLGDQRRQQILDAAVDVSTASGLEGLSIAELAREVGLSKGGLTAHFASKSDLQLASVDHAAKSYVEHVLDATEDAEPGIARLRAMMSAWLDWVDRAPYRAGCFFAAAGAALAGQPGPVRQRIAESSRALIRALEREARTASRLGELGADVKPRLLTFALHALVQEANLRKQLLDDPDAFRDARQLLGHLLQPLPTETKGEIR